MPERIPASVAYTVVFKAYLSDGVTAATGKTIAITISKNTAAFGNPSAGATNATEIASGWYYVALSTTDTGTAGPLLVHGTATGVDPVDLQLTVANAHNAGFDGVPNAAAEAAGGLYTRGTGAGQINQEANGYISVNLKAILGTVLTETAGQIAGGFKKLFDVAAPVFTLLSVNQTGDNYTRLGAPAGASVSADIAAIMALLTTVATYIDTEVAAIKAKTDQLTFTIANKVDSSIQLAGDFAQAAADKVWLTAARTLTAFGFSVTTTTADQQASADEFLNRNIAGGGSGGARIVRDAFRLLRNLRQIVAGVLTVMQEDDVTPAWTAAVTTAAGNPVDKIDPT
jgi:hypothetical protein